ncbi:hypothetical protein OB2597_18267 [Pseudooceanicola batsensis HTCC2597]|uniref:Lipoprotein n=1 Tax=Pseudooceanicola batsensis (strain ATCC BAA-863 / DSM 15984 / KCTC 12145 / HTCC2597) TaxID=252305 RepID=A3U057_PSEBH|nr:hypothetical protein [Pseudooceanicola batsensis]EAQ02688.1 hypothetical protein OB2597_18267 [Pseudooceanicola batsensis HTCC2597]
MIRFLLVLIGLGTLAACEPYQEPRANCFSFAASDPGADDCSFTPLAGATFADLRRE